MNRNQDTHRSSLRSLVLRTAALLLLAFGLFGAPAWADSTSRPLCQNECSPCKPCGSFCVDSDDNDSTCLQYSGAGGPSCLLGQLNACATECRGDSSASQECCDGPVCGTTTCGAFWAGPGSGGT